MSILDHLAPFSCAACGEGGWEGLCPPCREKLDALYDPRCFLCVGGNGDFFRGRCLVHGIDVITAGEFPDPNSDRKIFL